MGKLFCETCKAEDFLKPENFATGFDREPRGKSQYDEGLKVGRSADSVSIGWTGVWSASMKDGGSLISYEKIGYHANTAQLLQGFLDSGCEVWVYRQGENPARIA